MGKRSFYFSLDFGKIFGGVFPNKTPGEGECVCGVWTEKTDVTGDEREGALRARLAARAARMCARFLKKRLGGEWSESLINFRRR